MLFGCTLTRAGLLCCGSRAGHLYRAVHQLLGQARIRVEGDPEENAKSGDGYHVISSTGRDYKGGDALRINRNGRCSGT